MRQNRFGHYESLPLCEVSLIGPARTVPVIAAVDSGATHPFFPASSAADAGIDLSKARSFHVTFGGSDAFGKATVCYLTIGGRRLRAEVVFVDDIQLGYALLGRSGIFSQFNEVSFLERSADKRVEFRG